MEILHRKYEVDLTGELIPGSPVEKLANERWTHIAGNEPLYCCNIHFGCDLGKGKPNPEYHLYAGGMEITEIFTVRE